MRKISPVAAFVYIASMAALLIVLIPGLASAAVPDEGDVWGVVYSARNQNQSVLNQFAFAAVSASDVPTLDAHRAAADNALEDIYYWAVDQIMAHVAANPDLEGTATEALGQLLSEHNGAHAEVADIYATVYERLVAPPTTTQPPTTTTQPPTTTTTKAPTTTTTTAPRTTTTTAPPRTTTTTVPDTTTTVPETTTTIFDDTPRTTIAATPPPGGGPSDPPGGSLNDQIAALSDDQLWSTPSSMVAGESTVYVDGSMPPMTAAVSDAASVLLPPMLVKVAVAPILVLEVLFRTLFESARSLALPALMLAAAVGWFVWRERKAIASA